MARQPQTRNGNSPTEQDLQNLSFDPIFSTFLQQIMGSPDGTNAYKLVINQDGSMATSTSASALQLDNLSTPGIIYIGKAAIGSATSSAVWQIQQLNTATGLAITWAAGSNAFNQIWTNRTSLTYS